MPALAPCMLPMLAEAREILTTQLGARSPEVAVAQLELAVALGRLGRVRLAIPPHAGENYLLREMAFRVGRKHAARLRLLAPLLGGAVPLLLGLLALVATACPVSTPGGGGTTTTTIDPGPPVAVAGASPSIGDAPLTVTFDSSGSTAGSGTGLTFAWDFGDGSPVDNSIAPTHIYNTPGSYNAKLTLTNSAGTSTSPNIPIQVNVDPNPKYYVRTTGGTGSTCGPLANPCSTITQAVTNASANGIHAIRVAGGSFTGTVNVPSITPITLVHSPEPMRTGCSLIRVSGA